MVQALKLKSNNLNFNNQIQLIARKLKCMIYSGNKSCFKLQVQLITLEPVYVEYNITEDFSVSGLVCCCSTS